MSNKNEINMEKTIMSKVTSGEIKMKPKWYFIVGSIASFAGLVGFMLGSVFLTSFTLFLVLKRGPGTGRILMMLDSFPIWIPVLAVVFIVLGTLLLKRYEFSYRKNMNMIVFAIIAAILLSVFVINSTGLDDAWFNRGPLRRFYSQDYPSVRGIYHFRNAH